MKRSLLLALALLVILVMACGGAVEGVDDAASAAEWRCLPHTSAGASLPCDADAGTSCDCPSSCSYEGLAGSCTTR